MRERRWVNDEGKVHMITFKATLPRLVTRRNGVKGLFAFVAISSVARSALEPQPLAWKAKAFCTATGSVAFYVFWQSPSLARLRANFSSLWKKC